MIDREKVIKGLEETEIMLTQAVDRGGEMAVMGAFKCLNRVKNALDLLKEHDNCENCAIAIEDRQPVVRCRDCTFHNEVNCPAYYRRSELHDDWFCADGERKREDG